MATAPPRMARALRAQPSSKALCLPSPPTLRACNRGLPFPTQVSCEARPPLFLLASILAESSEPRRLRPEQAAPRTLRARARPPNAKRSSRAASCNERPTPTTTLPRNQNARARRPASERLESGKPAAPQARTSWFPPPPPCRAPNPRPPNARGQSRPLLGPPPPKRPSGVSRAPSPPSTRRAATNPLAAQGREFQ